MCNFFPGGIPKTSFDGSVPGLFYEPGYLGVEHPYTSLCDGTTTIKDGLLDTGLNGQSLNHDCEPTVHSNEENHILSGGSENNQTLLPQIRDSLKRHYHDMPSPEITAINVYASKRQNCTNMDVSNFYQPSPLVPPYKHLESVPTSQYPNMFCWSMDIDNTVACSASNSLSQSIYPDHKNMCSLISDQHKSTHEFGMPGNSGPCVIPEATGVNFYLNTEHDQKTSQIVTSFNCVSRKPLGENADPFGQTILGLGDINHSTKFGMSPPFGGTSFNFPSGQHESSQSYSISNAPCINEMLPISYATAHRSSVNPTSIPSVLPEFSGNANLHDDLLYDSQNSMNYYHLLSDEEDLGRTEHNSFLTDAEIGVSATSSCNNFVYKANTTTNIEKPKTQAAAYENSKTDLPVANIWRLMRREMPPNGKISKDATLFMQQCAAEFIQFIASEAVDRNKSKQRIKLNGILEALRTLGFDTYLPLLQASWGRRFGDWI